MNEVDTTPPLGGDYKKEYSLTQLGMAQGDNNGNAEDNIAAPAPQQEGVISYTAANPNPEPMPTTTTSQDSQPSPTSSPTSSPSLTPTTTNTSHAKEPKKKWNIFGIFKKKDKDKEKEKDKEKDKDKDKKKSGDLKAVDSNKKTPASNGNEAHGEKAVTDGANEPKEAEVEEKSAEKKVLVVSTIEELPEECQKLIKQSGIPQEKLEQNFKILVRVLHFRTGVIYKHPEDLDLPAYQQPPKSTRFRPGSDLVTEMGEMRKMYKEMDEVGKGGFGTVFHARSVKEKNKLVAIKKMPHTTRKQKSSNFHEVSILYACNHPNLVRFITCHEVKDELWIVMEYMEGGTFEEAAKAWNFNEANLAYVARELLKGIFYLHANQLAHRDLKSANIMMSIQGQVKLIDFGLCADMSTGLPRHMVGSPFWMPPEMIQGKPHNTAVDIWSFAISLLEMANQKPPMIESAVKAMFTVATEGCTELFVEPGKWSDTFKEFLGLCLKVDPAERATAEQLLKHPFIQLADTRTNMEHILRRIFLSNSLINSGF